MAIVEMSKLKIVALSCDKDKILNELFKTRCVELKKTASIDGTAYNFCEEEYEKLVKEEYADICVDYHKISAENIEKYVKCGTIILP